MHSTSAQVAWQMDTDGYRCLEKPRMDIDSGSDGHCCCVPGLGTCMSQYPCTPSALYSAPYHEAGATDTTGTGANTTTHAPALQRCSGGGFGQILCTVRPKRTTAHQRATTPAKLNSGEQPQIRAGTCKPRPLTLALVHHLSLVCLSCDHGVRGHAPPSACNNQSSILMLVQEVSGWLPRVARNAPWPCSRVDGACD